MNAELPVADLPDRYGISRSQVYARLDALKRQDATLAPEKRGKKAYVSGDLLEMMDSLQVLLSQGDSLAEAVEKVLHIPPQTRPMRPVGQSDKTQDSAMVPTKDIPSDLVLLAKAISGQQAEPDPLIKYRQLEEIAAHGWQLPTNELADLLGLKTLSGDTFERYGFRFERCGRAGSQFTWKVVKG